MAQKSSLKKNETIGNDDNAIIPKGWNPEAFPLVLGMKGKKIGALQKELKIPEDEFLGLQTEHHIIRLGYSLPLSEQDYKKIVKPEHVKIFEWIVRNIDNSDSTFQMDGCSELVKFFSNRKFKDPKPNESEVDRLAEILRRSILKKKEAIYKRNTRDKK